MTRDKAIEKCRKIHGDKYNYCLFSNEIERNQTVKIICSIHGPFKKIFNSHIDKGKGCPRCLRLKWIKSTDEFIDLARNIHGDRYNYSKSFFKSIGHKLIIICSEHGEFEVTPRNHIYNKTNCPQCAGNKLKTTKDFKKKARRIHNGKYNYKSVKYVNSKTKVKIHCKRHGVFLQTPTGHLSGRGCPKCVTCNKSKIEKEWLDFIGIPYGYRNIELKINGRIIKTDAYDTRTNTIYEFYGDYFHGNPNVFNRIDKNRLNKKSFGELYKKTIEREEFLRNNGYNLITIWESDWEKQKKKTNK